MMQPRSFLLTIMLTASGTSGFSEPAHRLELPVKQFPAQLEYENLGAEFSPTVIIVAHTDRESKPVKFLKGVTVNGARVTEKMLTGSVLKIRGDGTGLYGYTSGFGVPVVPPIAEATRSPMDVAKNAWDPVVGGTNGMYSWLLVTVASTPRRTTYELSFPDPIRIKKLTAQASCEAVPDGGSVSTQLHSDIAGKEIVAKKSFTKENGERYPHVFDGMNTNRVFLTFTGEGKGTALIYNVTFWAELDCSGLPKITAAAGRNSLSVSDDDDSSHWGRVFVEGFPKGSLPKPTPTPDPLANYVSPNKDAKPAKLSMIKDPREFFPRGFYWGLGCPHWDFVLDDMKTHHMNCIYGSNWWPEALEDFLPLAERMGIRCIYQGSSWGSFYYFTYHDKQHQQRSYEKELVPNFKTTAERVKNNPSLLMWSLTEEIAPGTAPFLSDYYRMVRELDPNHPPTVLHNNVAAARDDLTTNEPLVVTTDVYPFFLDPRSGPATPQRSLNFFAGRMEDIYKLCRQANASMWAMPQACGIVPDDSCDPPHFGPVGGFRKPTAAMVKVQAWVAVLKGATGVLYYPYISNHPGHSSLRDFDWSETEQLKGASDIFAQLEKVAGLLVRLERDFSDDKFVSSANPAVWIHTFKSRPENRLRCRYAVVANTDWENAQTLDLKLTQPLPANAMVYDCIAGKPSGGNAIALSPGDGMVLAFGSRQDIERDRKASPSVE
ncbi:MAG: hypothetical protein AUJ92_03540 [Armatimonadetes bacterium CG2_30_59_28]|nr:MAG: hypothetical protein AUJ92_03540 [Armatimonadetes bacterium CG2_30_59_28]PIU64296.1 MAG: hypothetical protein COS85_13115 [Armatimonadetes bacterium CG07_land_8_20_14_0_80_59_28]